jgi:hypothetical protein
MPTPFKGNKEYSNKEYRLNKLVSVNIFVIKDKTINNVKFYINTISY